MGTESLNKSIDNIELDVAEVESSSNGSIEPHSPGSPITNEFVSDSFQADEGLSEEERKQMLGTNETTEITNDAKNDNNTEEWEFDKELQDEIESFELVNEITG